MNTLSLIKEDDMDKVCKIIEDIIINDVPLYLDEYSMKDIKYTYNMVLDSILDGINDYCLDYKNDLIDKIAKKIYEEEGEEIDGYEG